MSLPPAATGSALFAAALCAGTGVLAHGMFAPRSSRFCPTVSRAGPGAGNRVALTFDDGPWAGSTDLILDTLSSHGALATFFIIGANAAHERGLLRRIHAEGHLIGNHTFDHHRTGLFGSDAYWRDQMARTNDVIATITGAPPRFFRAPMGFKSPQLGRAAIALGHTVVAWSRRAGDGVATTPHRIVSALRRLDAGEIALMHDGRDPCSRRDVRATAIALPTVLDGLRSRGLLSVRLDELLPVT